MATQNPDGGWPYGRGGPSWTEPTVYALLALEAAHETPEALDRGRAWLRRMRRPDGGWPPHPSVDRSTWVTALVVLLEPETADSRAVQWLVGRAGRESSRIERFRQWLLGNRDALLDDDPGWPWFPGTAAWTTPTSVSVLALQKVQKRRPSSAIQERIARGQRFLLSHICQDGGWNGGPPRALGYPSCSYPETTGVALLALHGTRNPQISSALVRAEKHLARCRSVESASWLELALVAHGRVPGAKPAGIPARTVPDAALRLLAGEAIAGRNLFLE